MEGGIDWGTLVAVLGSGTLGAFARDALQFWKDRRKANIEERASATGAAHELAETASDLAEQYKKLAEDQRRQFEAAFEQERAHCDRRIEALENEVEELRGRIRELEQQSGAVDVTALRGVSP